MKSIPLALAAGIRDSSVLKMEMIKIFVTVGQAVNRMSSCCAEYSTRWIRSREKCLDEAGTVEETQTKYYSSGLERVRETELLLLLVPISVIIIPYPYCTVTGKWIETIFS